MAPKRTCTESVNACAKLRLFGVALFHNWQFAPVVSVHRGLPINITLGTDVSQAGIGLDRPTDPYISTSDPRDYIDRAAFQTSLRELRPKCLDRAYWRRC